MNREVNGVWRCYGLYPATTEVSDQFVVIPDKFMIWGWYGIVLYIYIYIDLFPKQFTVGVLS